MKNAKEIIYVISTIDKLRRTLLFNLILASYNQDENNISLIALKTQLLLGFVTADYYTPYHL